MKLTGMILVIIGIVGGALALFQSLLATTPIPPPDAPEVAATAFPNAQLVFSVATLVIGGLLVAFGGSGVIKSRDPAVRN